MRIPQDDFARFIGPDFGFVTKTDHVACVLATRLIAHHRLTCEEGLEAFLAKPCQNLAGRNVRVAFGAARVRLPAKDRRGKASNLVVAEWCGALNLVDVLEGFEIGHCKILLWTPESPGSGWALVCPCETLYSFAFTSSSAGQVPRYAFARRTRADRAEEPRPLHPTSSP